MVNKRLINTGAEAAPAEFDPLQNFETVTYTGNGGTQKITGYIRKGAAFNGSSSVIDFSQPLLINTFSVSFWINSTGTASQRILGNAYGGAGDYGWNIRIEATTGHLEVEWSADGTNAIILDTATSVTDGNWHHIVATWDEGSQKIYIDDNEEASSTNASDQYATTDTFKIGANWNNTAHYNGKLDQVRIFNKELSSSEVTTLYGETHASSTKSTTDIFGDGSGVALYELDEDASDTGSVFAAKFNGSSTIEAIDSTLSSNTIRSYSAWIRKTTGGEQYILSNNNGTNYGAHLLVSSSNVLQGWVYNNANSGYYFNLNSGGSITLDKWHHVALTWGSTASDCKIYLDGTLTQTASSVSGSVPTTNAPNNLRIGSYNSNVYFNGLIRDVRVYSSILSAANVSNLYSETNIPTSNLVSHYQLNENADDSQGSNDGTWSGTEAYEGKYGGTPTNVNFLGMAFQPDLVWIKGRDAALSHVVHDVQNQPHLLITNGTNALITNGSNLVTFTSNGFDLQGGADQTSVNGLNDFVAWAWKAGGAAVDGSGTNVTSVKVSANQDAGFSIVKYNYQSSLAATISHGLSAAPEMIILKVLDATTPSSWFVYHSSLGASKEIYLNLTNTGGTDANRWNNTSPTSTVFSIGTSFGSYPSYYHGNHIAYCFHSVDGYQKVGSYSGTGTVNNQINVGFRPRFVMQKRSDSTGSWNIIDNQRGDDNYLSANLSNAEGSMTASSFHLTDTGFTLDNSFSEWNASGGTYIYLAIA